MTDIDAKSELTALNSKMVVGNSIEEIEAAWAHYHSLETYVEIHQPDNKEIKQALQQIGDGLGHFTKDVRNNMPSPFEGFRPVITRLRALLEDRYDAGGYPRR